MAASQTIRTLKLSLLADTSGFSKNLKGAETSFKTFERNIAKAAVPATAAFAGLATAAFSAITAASDLEQTFGAVEQIFGGRAARQLDQFARDAAESLGQSRQEALGAAQTFGILGRTAGLEGEELADFAIQLSTLASDLAAFGNSTPQDAIEALGSALRGEFNPIERYGVVLNAAAVQQQALSAGLAETAQEITAADQVYARFLAIVEQTQIQQGQFARESESLASQTAIAKAQLENFRVEVGEQLLPAFVEFLPFLREAVDNFVALDPEQVIAFAEGLAILTGAIIALNVALRGFAALQGAWAALASPLGAVGAIALGVSASSEEGALTEAEALAAYGRVINRGPAARLQALTARESAFGNTIVNVDVAGFVGNERELARAIQRAQEQARRSGSVRQGTGSFG